MQISVEVVVGQVDRPTDKRTTSDERSRDRHHFYFKTQSEKIITLVEFR